MSKKLTFKTIEDVKRWCDEPKKHPIEGYEMSAISKDYYDIYEKAYKIMKKGSFSEEYIINLFPKNHLYTTLRRVVIKLLIRHIYCICI